MQRLVQAFKLALFPFHGWAPDVYQGGPTPVTAFLSVVPKGAVLIALLRIVDGMELAILSSHWVWAAGTIAVASQFLGNIVAIVTQDVQLFQASVRDNLTFFDRDIPDERILAVVEDLELMDWYRALPEGLDTRLEGGGRDLSAGEAQLLAFARVFLRDPGLVILDEASSRLDPATEQRVERAVDKLLQDRTAIVIAHRLGTVHRADDIMILEAGRVAEYGGRERLAGDPSSRFHNLLQTGLEEVLA